MTRENKGDLLQSGNDITALVEAYRQSGLSLEAFARERGIRPSRLHYWVYQKNHDAKRRSLAGGRGVRQRSVFQEVKLEAGSGLFEIQSWAAEVSLGGGINARFSGTARPEWIGAVIQALQRPC